MRDDIDREAWRAIDAIIEARVERRDFAEDFPKSCEDGGRPFATDRQAFFGRLYGDVPALRELGHGVPSTFDALDAVEFAYAHISQAVDDGYHPHFRHTHLRFDRGAGRASFREDINRLFRRQGLVYELNEDGRVVRVAAGPPEAELAEAQFATGDDELDRLLSEASRHFFAVEADSAALAVEKLWDAFERLKAFRNPNNKAASIAAILESAEPAERIQTLIAAECQALTAAGNDLQIRHHEARTQPLGSDQNRRYFFMRLWSLIWRLLPHLEQN